MIDSTKRRLISSAIALCSLFVGSVFTDCFGNASASNEQNAVAEKPKISLNETLDHAWALRYTKPDSAMFLILLADSLAELHEDTHALVTAAVRRGSFLKDRGQWSEADGLFRTAIALAADQSDSIGVARALINAAQNHKLHGDYDAALPDILRAIRILESEEYPAYLNVSYTTLAGIYLQLKQHENAASIYERLLTESTERNDSAGMSSMSYNLGIAHFEMDHYPIAIDFLSRSLKLSQKINKPMSQARANNALGSVHFQLGKLDSALQYFTQAETLCRALKMEVELSSVLNNLAEVHAQLGKPELALADYRKAVSLAAAMGNQHHRYRMYLNLSRTFQQLEKSDSALHYHQRYASLKDSVFNRESQQQLAEVQTKYETEKKDANIARLNAVEDAQKAKLEQRRLWLIGIGLIALLLAIAVLVYLSKLRMQRAMAEQKEELHRQSTVQLVNENSTKTMKAYLNGETAERQRLAGELHDRLGSQLAAVKLFYEQVEISLENQTENELVSKANRLLDKSCADVREIAHNLSGDTLQVFGLEPAVADLAATISESGRLNVRMRSIGMDERLPATLELVLFRAVQELVTNVIKHAKATEIVIELKSFESHFGIAVIDNGSGLDSEKPAGDGIGIGTIQKRITALGGAFSLTSNQASERSGTTARIEIPHHTYQTQTAQTQTAE